MNLEIDTIIGIIGVLFILVGFVLNQRHKLNQDSFIYDGINFIGAGLLVIYSILLNSVPFTILNLVWAGMSLIDIIRRNK